MEKLRLLLFAECERNCPGCCNNDWDLSSLPQIVYYTGYDEILLTGGEPLLHPNIVKHTIRRIRKETATPIYLYTATNNVTAFLDILQYVDGICLTIHEQRDVQPFKILNKILMTINTSGRSLRLNIFHNIILGNINLIKWKVKNNIAWIKNYPLPENEIFMRL